MLKKNKILTIFLIVFFFFVGCNKNTANEDTVYHSYRDIPGVTNQEITAIENLKAAMEENRDTFVYSMLPTTEAFIDFDGNTKGFTALFCEYLSELFGIPFKLKLKTSWNSILEGLDDYSIDFTSGMTETEQRKKDYFMTDAVSERIVRYFVLAGSEPILEIAKRRPPRYAFMNNTIIYPIISSNLDSGTYEYVFIDDFDSVYNALKNEEIDAYLHEEVLEFAFKDYKDVVVRDFLPFTYSLVPLTAKNPKLEPIISVVQKALQANPNTSRRLNELQKQGYQEYRRYKFFNNLSFEEKEYIKNNPVIPFVSEHYNYPISFYNKYEKEWQGIFVDVLQQVSDLTGLAFQRVNDNKTEWGQLLQSLESGNAYLVAELIPTKERKEKGFLWAKIPTTVDKYALLSKSSTPNINFKDIRNVRVGLPKKTAYAEVFISLFPDHPNIVEYESSDEAFAALDRGEVDVIMSSQRRLLAITNHHEYSGYKANFVFEKDSESFIGFNGEHALLASIFSKALGIVDIADITDQWMKKTYDYAGKIAKAQQPWLIGVSVLLLLIVIFLFVFFKFEGKRLEELVKERSAELEQANQAKSMFLATMSHEIRTPMNAIIGMTELILKEDLSQKVRNQANTVKRSAKNLLSIINDILDFSKIESGKMEIIPVKYSLSSLMNDSISIIQAKIIDAASQIKFITDIDNSIPDSLFGDETRVRQVLLNVLSNAVKYTPKGSVTFVVKGEIAENKEEIVLKIDVIDTGKGIKEEDMNKLFGEFSRLDLLAHKGIEGTGLGLAITKKLVDAMDGTINVSSVYGEGSTFSISIPQKIVSQQPISDLHLNTEESSEVSSKVIEFSAPSAKVLVVDDNEVNLMVAEGLLYPYNMQVDLCLSGAESIEKTKNNSYDLVFMDHMMPEMDGIEATKLIREFDGNLPIIALTANAVSGMKEMFLENGFNDFLSKPIDTKKLNAILEKWIPKDKREK